MSSEDSRFAALKQGNLVPAAVDALARTVREAPDEALHRINVFDFATRHKLDATAVIDVFLHAAKQGLFELSWDLLCPGCGGILGSSATLKSVNQSRYNCTLCACAYETTLDELVEVSFTVSPAVRRIAAHAPDRLPLWSYYRQIYFSNCLDMPVGAEWEKMAGEITLEREELEPGAKMILSTTLPPRFLILFEPVTHSAVFLDVKGEPTQERQELTARFAPGSTPSGTITLRPGNLRLTLENRMGTRLLPAIFIADDNLHRLFARRASLTGKTLLSNQTFRDLFRTDTLDAGQQLKVTSLTVLFTDLKGSTALYERVGDLAAYDLVRAHFSVLTAAVKAAGGAVVKTIGDAVMATFPTPEEGMRAALAMRTEMDTLNASRAHEDLIVKIGLHEGPCLAVISNERLDYFGQTVNIAARIQGLAESRAIFTTQPVILYPGVASLLKGAGLASAPRQAVLRGIREEITVYEIP